jgi:hypothetical protein
MTIKKVTGAMIVVMVVSLLVACGGSSSKQDPAVNEAIKALRKIEAATQVGVNFPQYNQLLIEAKAQVNEASAKLTDGELKRELNLAMEAYVDAGQVWNNKIQQRLFLPNIEPGKTIIPKYSLKTQINFLGQPEANMDAALQTIWAAAKTHLDRVSVLLQK